MSSLVYYMEHLPVVVSELSSAEPTQGGGSTQYSSELFVKTVALIRELYGSRPSNQYCYV